MWDPPDHTQVIRWGWVSTYESKTKIYFGGSTHVILQPVTKSDVNPQTSGHALPSGVNPIKTTEKESLLNKDLQETLQKT